MRYNKLNDFFVHKSYSANGMEYQSSKIKDLKKAEAYSISYFRKFNFEKYETFKTKLIEDFHKDIAIPYFNVRKLTNEKRYKWEKEHLKNQTGTKNSYYPSASVFRNPRSKKRAEYEQWSPKD